MPPSQRPGGAPSAQFREFRWLWPPRPDGAIPPSALNQYAGFVAQPKYNDVRTVTYVFPDGQVRFFNRHGNPLVSRGLGPWHERAAREIARGPGSFSILDGGTTRLRVPGYGIRLVLWDVLVWQGRHLVGATVAERYRLLRFLCGDPSGWETETGARVALKTRWPGVWLAPWFESGLTEEYQTRVHVDEIEGLVLKDPRARLAPAFGERNNGAWQIRVRKPHANYAF